MKIEDGALQRRTRGRAVEGRGRARLREREIRQRLNRGRGSVAAVAPTRQELNRGRGCAAAVAARLLPEIPDFLPRIISFPYFPYLL